MLDRRELLAAGAVAVAGVATRAPVGRVFPRPVLYIDLDDVGHELLAEQIANGGAPTLARLFSPTVGRSFSRFWAAPNCSVFRSRVLSGLEPYRAGNLTGRIVTPSDHFAGPSGAWMPSGLAGQKVKLGKWHVSAGPSFPMGLISGGFDRFVGMRGNLSANGGSYYSWEEWTADASGWSVSTQTQHNTTRIAQLALAEVAALTDLVHVSFNAVHEPLANPPDNEPAGKVYTGTTDDEVRKNMLFHVDYWLGQVTRAAIAAGYVVFIACDNGTDGSGKGTHYETGINTDLVVVGQGVLPGLSDRLVQATDLWATVRRLRGDPLTTCALDAYDFCDEFLPVPQVHAPRDFLRTDWFPFLGVQPPPDKWSRMIRDARWKYVDQKTPPAGIPLEVVVGLWDLENDPAELVNLLDSPLTPEARAALAVLLANLQT